MDQFEENELIADLEYTLNAKLRPIFLIITKPSQHPEGDIYIMISTLAFKNMTIEKRIRSVFSLIIRHIPHIIKDRLVVVQAYSGDELQEVIQDIFNGD